VKKGGDSLKTKKLKHFVSKFRYGGRGPGAKEGRGKISRIKLWRRIARKGVIGQEGLPAQTPGAIGREVCNVEDV